METLLTTQEQQKLTVLSDSLQQKGLCDNLLATLRTLSLSWDIRRAELLQLQNDFQVSLDLQCGPIIYLYVFICLLTCIGVSWCHSLVSNWSDVSSHADIIGAGEENASTVVNGEEPRNSCRAAGQRSVTFEHCRAVCFCGRTQVHSQLQLRFVPETADFT